MRSRVSQSDDTMSQYDSTRGEHILDPSERSRSGEFENGVELGLDAKLCIKEASMGWLCIRNRRPGVLGGLPGHR